MGRGAADATRHTRCGCPDALLRCDDALLTWLHHTDTGIIFISSLAGVTAASTTRFLISPLLRVFVGRFIAPLPTSVAEIVSWAADPVALLRQKAIDPVGLLFRTQYYLAYDARVTKVPAPRGRRHLRAAAESASVPTSALALRAALAARIVAEAPALLANCTLRLPGDDVPFARRTLLQAPAPAPDPALDALDALLRVSPAATALGLLGLDAASSGGWAAALALALTWQVSAFTAQLADARLGAQLEATSRPAATAALFARVGIEIDAGINTRERLSPRNEARASGPASSAASPPPPPPAPSIVVPLPALAGGAALLTSLQAWAAAAGLPAASLAPLSALASALASHAGNATSARLPPFVRRAAFVISPFLSLGLGQVAFTLPTDAAALAAALAAPSLAPLLNTDVSFENSIGVFIDFAFIASAPLLSFDKRLLPRHRRRSLHAATDATAITPAAVFAAFRAALLDSSATAPGHSATALVRLFASLQGVEFSQVSFQLFVGVAALEAVSADARPGLSALVEAQKFAILRTTFAAGTRLTARLVRQP